MVKTRFETLAILFKNHFELYVYAFQKKFSFIVHLEIFFQFYLSTVLETLRAYINEHWNIKILIIFQTYKW